MTRPAGKAAIQIVGDVSDFAKNLERDLNKAVRGVDVDTKPLTNQLVAGAKVAATGVERALGGISVDRTFEKIASDADRAMDAVAHDANRAGDAIGDHFQAGGETAEAALEELDRSAGNQFRQIAAKASASAGGMSSRFLGAFSIIKGAAVAATAAVVGGLGALTVFGLKAASNIEQTTIGLEALLGNAEQAKKFLVELQKFSAATPFEFGDVADASRRILAFGTSVGITRDKVIPTLTTIGDLVSVLGGTAENAESVIRALGQIASKGKLSQEEILQLAEALPGFNANAAIASATGLSVADTLKKITAGEIDAKTGINALLVGMAKFPGAAGAMAKQSQTLQGVFSTFKDTISIALSDAFTPVIPSIKETLTELTPIIGDAVKVIAPILGEFLTKLLPLIGVALKALAPILGIFTDLAGTLLAALAPSLGRLAPVIERLVAGLAPLAIVIGEFLAKALDELISSGALDEIIDMLLDLAPAAIDLLLALLPLLPVIAQLITLFLQTQAPLIELLALWVQFASSKVAPVIADVAKEIGGLLDKLLGAGEVISEVKNWPMIFEKFGDVVGPVFDDALDSVGEFFAGIGNWFAELPGKIGGFLAELPAMVGHFFEDMFLKAIDAISFGIGLIIGAMFALPPLIIGALFALPGLLADFVTGLMADLGSLIANGWAAVIDFFTVTVPQQISFALNVLPGIIGGAFTAALDWAKKAVVDGFNSIIAFATSVPTRLVALGGQMLAAGKSLISGFFSGLSAVGGFIGDIASGIFNGIKGLLNRVISGINSGIARVDESLPFDLPRLPQLAEGGLTTAEGVANLHPRELVLPLEDRRAVDLLAAAMREAQAGLAAVGVPGAQPQFEVNVLLSPESFRELARVEIREVNRSALSRVQARTSSK